MQIPSRKQPLQGRLRFREGYTSILNLQTTKVIDVSKPGNLAIPRSRSQFRIHFFSQTGQKVSWFLLVGVDQLELVHAGGDRRTQIEAEMAACSTVFEQLAVELGRQTFGRILWPLIVPGPCERAL